MINHNIRSKRLAKPIPSSPHPQDSVLIRANIHWSSNLHHNKTKINGAPVGLSHVRAHHGFPQKKENGDGTGTLVLRETRSLD